MRKRDLIHLNPVRSPAANYILINSGGRVTSAREVKNDQL
jgi:hypothetical protein